MRVFANVFRGDAETSNVLAETTGGQRQTTSSWSARTWTRWTPVPASTTTARARRRSSRPPQQMAKVNPRNTVRFALVGRGGGGPRRLGPLRVRPVGRGAGRDRPVPELRHDRLAELRPVRLRRRRVGVRSGRPARVGTDRELLHQLLRQPRSRVGGDRDLVPLRLRGVLRQRHPVRWAVHRRRGRQDGAAGRDLRRHGGRRLRPVLPPGLRHLRQQQQRGARSQQRLPSRRPR